MILTTRGFYLLSYLEWGDESETIVTAKMMASGGKLFLDIFNHHGPLTFVPGFILESFGSFGLFEHRLIILALQTICLIVVFRSHLNKTVWDKITRTSLIGMVISFSLSESFGHMYKYQVLAGIALLISAITYILPSIIPSEKMKPTSIFWGSFLLTSLPFFAVTYGPTSVLLMLAAFRKENLRFSFYGIVSALLLNSLVITFLTSWPGYFAYHFYLNLKVLPQFTGQTSLGVLSTSVIKGLANQAIFGLLALLSFILLLFKHNTSIFRATLFLAGTIMLLIRGGGTFHSLPFYYLSLTSILLFRQNLKFLDTKISVFTLLSALVLYCLLTLETQIEKISDGTIRAKTDFAKIANLVTKIEDRVIAYGFQNYEYLSAMRLPASGYFFYLPWQEKYNQAPILGITINPCNDLQKRPPKIMLIDRLTIPGLTKWEDYGSCIEQILSKKYKKVVAKPIFIRTDVVTENNLVLEKNSIHIKN